MPKRSVLRDRSAETDLEIVGVRTKHEQIYGFHVLSLIVPSAAPSAKSHAGNVVKKW